MKRNKKPGHLVSIKNVLGFTDNFENQLKNSEKRELVLYDATLRFKDNT